MSDDKKRTYKCVIATEFNVDTITADDWEVDGKDIDLYLDDALIAVVRGFTSFFATPIDQGQDAKEVKRDIVSDLQHFIDHQTYCLNEDIHGVYREPSSEKERGFEDARGRIEKIMNDHKERTEATK